MVGRHRHKALVAVGRESSACVSVPIAVRGPSDPAANCFRLSSLESGQELCKSCAGACCDGWTEHTLGPTGQGGLAEENALKRKGGRMNGDDDDHSEN